MIIYSSLSDYYLGIIDSECWKHTFKLNCVEMHKRQAMHNFRIKIVQITQGTIMYWTQPPLANQITLTELEKLTIRRPQAHDDRARW